MIHPTAIIEEGATVGAGCTVQAGAIIRRGTVLEEGVVVHPYAVVGGDPQDLRFDPATPSGVRIGAGTVIREFVTVHRSTRAGGETVIGPKCFLMASSHVGHDCVVGAGVVLANAALLAGHVSIGDGSFIGGGAAVHQHGRVGEAVMVAGLARVASDVPPYVMVAERSEVAGLNVVGLRRRGIAREAVRELKTLFHAVYRTPGNIREVAAGLAAGVTTAEGRRFLEFFAQGRRPFARPAARGTRAAESGGDASPGAGADVDAVS